MVTSKIPLIAAAAAGDLTTVTRLIEQGADLNVRDDCGWTPLHATLMHVDSGSGRDFPEKIACAKALLAAGADPNKPNHKGETPLIHAACSDRVDLLQTLLMFGADPGHKDQGGMTALDHAKEEGREGAVRVLEKNCGALKSRAVQLQEKPFTLRTIL